MAGGGELGWKIAGQFASAEGASAHFVGSIIAATRRRIRRELFELVVGGRCRWGADFYEGGGRDAGRRPDGVEEGGG